MIKRTCILLGLLMLFSGSVVADPGSDPTKLKLKESPRLWVSQETLHHLRDKLHAPYLQSQAKRILEDAEYQEISNTEYSITLSD